MDRTENEHEIESEVGIKMVIEIETNREDHIETDVEIEI